MKKKYLKALHDNKFVLLTNIAERLFFFIIFLLAANNYPSPVYGQLVTIFSLANIFVTILDLGLPFYVQREFSILKTQSASVLANVLAANVLCLPVYLAVLFAAKHFFYAEVDFNLFVITIITVYVFSLSNLLNKALSGLSMFRQQFMVLFSYRLISMILLIAAIYFLHSELWVAMLMVLTGAIMQLSALNNSLRKRNISITISQIRLKQITGIIAGSAPLGLAVIFYFLYDKIDILIISKLKGFDEVAYYSAGYGIYRSSAIVFSFIFTTGLTQISFLGRNPKAVKLFLRKYSYIVLCLSILPSFFFIFFSDVLIKILYPDTFSQSALILKILAAAIPGMALSGLTGMILNGLGKFKENMTATFTGLTFNVILNLILIPVYGIIGAAVAALISEYIFFAGYYFFIKRLLRGK